MEELIIQAGRSEGQYWRDVWRYRNLFYFLAWRDILVRYKQTVVGAVWAVLRPVLTMAVLTIVFGKLARLPAGGAPYPILVFCGMLPWQFFATAMTECGNSLVLNRGMITKIYFPRMIVPASSVITSMVDFAISAGILVVLMAWYQYAPTLAVLALPGFVALAFAAAFGVGLWISTLMVKYRDFRFIVPFVVQFGLYISPVAFYSKIIPEKWRLLYYLNPMAGVIDGFRWAILGREHTIYWPGLFMSIGLVLFLIISGIAYFRKTERTFADVI
jgi:lipopolysaccharide transport system permease protein